MEDSRIKKVSELLTSFFDGEIAAKGEKYVEFSNSWRTIAGSRLGEHSRPVEIRRGVLIVEAEHSGWIQLLQLHQEKILAEIQRRYPDLEVSGVAFVLGNGAPVEAVVAAAAPPVSADQVPQEASPLESRDAGPGPSRAETGGLPPELLAKFKKIRKNIEKY